ncbi:MAG: phage portal protein [Actinomycetaceae bacterium]|nr:phage portal protein [Arcanobacterium sp.]MDD7504735.1 phage portal protein [Actinomycetaceae bacterium]MDY6142742.1 phage portal protein [Arcanobacterium sp.]
MNGIKHLIERAGLATWQRSAPESETPVYEPLTTPILPTRTPSSRDPRTLDAVYRALAILETSTRQLTIDVWRNDDLIPYTLRPSWLRQPSLELHSFGQFTAETVSSLAQRGNAYWRIYRYPNGDISELVVLDPMRVGVTWKNTAREARAYTLDGRPIRRDQIMHLRLNHTPGELLGLSPLDMARATITGALDTAAYGATWTSTGGAPAGILTTDQPLTAEQANAYKSQANETLQYSQGIAVLGSGLHYQKLMFTPAEIQFLESQRDAVTKIARMYGIPAKMLLAAVDGSSDTYSNAETENKQFIRQTLMQYLSEIEDALTALTPNRQTVRYNLDGLLRADTKTRYEAHAIGLNAGFLTIDEVRQIEGLQPLDDPSEKDKTNEAAI